MSQQNKTCFSKPPERHEFSALLFDMDGTIIDSTDAIVKAWHELGRELGVDGDEILKSSHGRRTIDNLAVFAPQVATWEFVNDFETSIPFKYGSSAVEIPGSRAILDQVKGEGAPWAIVTSGTKGLVTSWLQVMNLAMPKVLVTAEEVQNGKPDPACYRLGAERLGLGSDKEELTNCLVLEDAPAGIKAGKAAGFRVVALATTHDVQILKEAGADWIVRDMTSVKLTEWNMEARNLSLEISDALL